MNIENGLVIVGCGKMGTAMLEGWLESGISPNMIWVLEPSPGPLLQDLAQNSLHLNAGLPASPALCLLAVKPQYMNEALPQLQELQGGPTVFLSIAAGISLDNLAKALGAAPIIRAMPNTPAAIGKGITALIGNALVSPENMHLATALLGSIGETLLLDTEAQMDAVTALSGSGPAYVFYLIEALTAAGVAEGLPEGMASKLAIATVSGAGQLAQKSDVSARELRINVTSPSGTTEAGLKELMNAETGLAPLIKRTVAAAAQRSRALRDG